MTASASLPHRCSGEVVANEPVSSGLMRLDISLPASLAFEPGQFAMLNLEGFGALVFSRPFSILAAGDGRISFLYRVVGRGTAALAALTVGAGVTVLGSLGHAFPGPEADRAAVLVAGGVGLPPLAAWWDRYGRPGDAAFFGARDGADVPWDLLGSDWQVSVDRSEGVPSGRLVFTGLVPDLVRERLGEADASPRMVLACGPLPLLRAAADLAAERGWECWLSLEEHMGCGYGVCKGCVVPVRSATPEGWRNATCCQEGPVFAASDIVWERHHTLEHTETRS